MGTATDTAEWNPQRVGNGVGEPTIRTGGDVQQVETAIEQLLMKGIPIGALEGIFEKKAIGNALVGLKHTPGKQRAHVQLTDPGIGKNQLGQLIAQLGLSQALGATGTMRSNAPLVSCS